MLNSHQTCENIKDLSELNQKKKKEYDNTYVQVFKK